MTKDQFGNELQVGDKVIVQNNSFSGPKFGSECELVMLLSDEQSTVMQDGKSYTMWNDKLIKVKGE